MKRTYTETPAQVVEREVLEWLAERAAASRNQAELEARSSQYVDEINRQFEAGLKREAQEDDWNYRLQQMRFREYQHRERMAGRGKERLPLPRIGWLDLLLAVVRGR